MATINLGSGNDVRSGTSGADSIYGNGGTDTLRGLDGDDLLDGGIGNDSLYGGLGADTLKGGSGIDRLYGEDGNDLLYGGSGADRLDGGLGRDTVSYYGESGHVTVDLVDNRAITSTGTDTLVSIERARGTEGDDLLFGVNTGDPEDWRSTGTWLELFGLGGNDVVFGGRAGDVLQGNDGDDFVFGYQGADRLDGGAGADELTGGEGSDVLVGGAGRDVFDYNLEDTDDYLLRDFGGGRDIVADFARGTDKLAVNVEYDLPPFLYVSGQAVFTELDSNHDGKLTTTDLWVDQRNVTFDGSTKASLVLDIGRGVGHGMFGGTGEDTLTIHGVTTLTKSDFLDF